MKHLRKISLRLDAWGSSVEVHSKSFLETWAPISLDCKDIETEN